MTGLPATASWRSEQLGHGLVVLEHVLGPAGVVREGGAGVDVQDPVQRCQDMLHPDGPADNVLATGVGGTDNLAGAQPATRDPQESSLRPVTPTVRRDVADTRRAA